MPYFVALFVLLGVVFSYNSMTFFSFNSGAKRTLTIVVDYGILAHIP